MPVRPHWIRPTPIETASPVRFFPWIRRERSSNTDFVLLLLRWHPIRARRSRRCFSSRQSTFDPLRAITVNQRPAAISVARGPRLVEAGDDRDMWRLEIMTEAFGLLQERDFASQRSVEHLVKDVELKIAAGGGGGLFTREDNGAGGRATT